MTVRQLLLSLDSRELAEWQGFFRIENEKHKKMMDDTPNVEHQISTGLGGFKR